MAVRKSIYQYDKEYYEGRRTQNFYSYGSAAAKPAEIVPFETEEAEEATSVRPEREYEDERKSREGVTAKPEKKTKTRVRRSLGMSVFSSLFLLASIGVTLLFCIGYIKMTTEINDIDIQTSKTASALATACDINNEIADSLNAPVDYDYVYAYAVKNLGMVYPSEDQIVYYRATGLSNVVQYGDIPEYGTGR